MTLSKITFELQSTLVTIWGLIKYEFSKSVFLILSRFCMCYELLELLYMWQNISNTKQTIIIRMFSKCSNLHPRLHSKCSVSTVYANCENIPTFKCQQAYVTSPSLPDWLTLIIHPLHNYFGAWADSPGPSRPAITLYTIYMLLAVSLNLAVSVIVAWHSNLAYKI